MMIEVLMVFIGGALGAVCRYAISSQMKRLLSTRFPLATFLINLLGSFLLGLLLTYQTNPLILLLFGTGFMGGFTTFSTFQVENVLLFRKRDYATLFLYLILTVGLCIFSAVMGFALGSWIKY